MIRRYDVTPVYLTLKPETYILLRCLLPCEIVLHILKIQTLNQVCNTCWRVLNSDRTHQGKFCSVNCQNFFWSRYKRTNRQSNSMRVCAYCGIFSNLYPHWKRMSSAVQLKKCCWFSVPWRKISVPSCNVMRCLCGTGSNFDQQHRWLRIQNKRQSMIQAHKTIAAGTDNISNRKL